MTMPTTCRDEGHEYTIDETTTHLIAINVEGAPDDLCYLHTCIHCGDRRWAPTHRGGEPVFPDVVSWPKAP